MNILWDILKVIEFCLMDILIHEKNGKKVMFKFINIEGCPIYPHCNGQ